MLKLNSKAWDVLLPWKCASQTVRTRLSGHFSEQHSELFYLNKILNRVRNQHHTFSDYLAISSPNSNRKVASFVRNPYDRVVSGFIQLCRDASAIPKFKFSDPIMRDYISEQVAINTQDIIRSGYDVNEWFMRLSPYRILDDSNPTFLLHPAHFWTHSSGKVVDFLGKVENFESDFSRLLKFIEIDANLIGKQSVNVSSISSNAPGSKPYKHIHLLKKKTIDRINSIFSDDFIYLDYSKIDV